MKLLIVLILVISQQALGQIDYPTKPIGSNEWAEYAWIKYSSSGLGADEFQLIENEIHLTETSNLNRFKLHIIASSFSLNLRPFRINQSFYDDKEMITFLAVNDEYLHTIALDKKLQLSITKMRKELKKINSLPLNSKNNVKETLGHDSSISSYQSGKYNRTIRLFLLCRKDRNYPCLFLLKDKFGDFVRKDNGKLWSLAALAKSRRNINYNKTNGHTPTGIHRMDSVMPEANRQIAFGKFRRVILNWIGNQNNEAGTLSFIPRSQHKKTWWKRAVIARDVGRKYLRIHGTGKINDNPASLFYPHVPTSGCISTLEGTYSGIKYIGQREVLDEVLKASQLAPIYSNEEKISGILYVMELDNKKSAVTLRDLKDIGIK